VITCNGHPVLSARITAPFSGAWVAFLELDADEPIAGALKIEDASGALFGYAVRSGVSGGACAVQAVGGRGGFAPSAPDVPARSYLGATAREVVSDILAAGGERMSGLSSPLSTNFPYWTRAAGRASAALSVLADHLDARWRVQPDGLVWFGSDSWAAQPSSYEADEIDRDHVAGTVQIAPDTIGLLPGVTFNGDRVGRVEHVLGRNEPLRTTYWVAE